MKTTPLFIVAGAVALVVALIGFQYYLDNRPTALDPFAQCLSEKKAVFYGAFWCPHCQDQKKMFGSAQKSLPYVECSTPDGKEMLQVCKDAKIEGFPTWVFADGERMSGTISLEKLAEKTQCILP